MKYVMIGVGIIAVILLLVVIGRYLYSLIKRIAVNLGVDYDKKISKVITIIISLAVLVSCVNIFSMSSIIILHIVVVAAVVDLINFIIKKITKGKSENSKIWQKLVAFLAIPAMVTAVLVTYGYFNMMNVVRTDYSMTTEKNIREEGYRVALIADVHFSVSVDIAELRKKCSEIEAADVDMVLLCGDIVDENTSNEDMKVVFEALGSIKSEFGVFYVYGNHDRQLYRSNKSYTLEELENTIKSNGITILRDEFVEINDEFILAGREDASYAMSANAEPRLPIDEILSGVDQNKFILTMDHQPKQYKEENAAGTDLMLSGHTHAGQIWPANILFKIAKFDDAVYGETVMEHMKAFVTSGFAGWGYTIKTSAPAEYVIVEISGK